MFKDGIKEAIISERNAIEEMERSLDYDNLENICQLINNCQGKIIFLGVGKSGHVCKKLAATFSSTGTPSFFVHGTEACHGDLGMIEKEDIVILMSNSGTTKEVTQNLEPIKKIGATTIAFTSNPNSKLALECDYKIIYPKLKEADHLNLAPTNSSTMCLVLGDAIACAISKSNNFTKDDFYNFHPNGALGESLRKQQNNK